MRWVLVAIVASGAGGAASGCLYDDLTAPQPVSAGGTVTVQSLTTTALARDTAEPLVVEGASAALTFSLTAADDSSGGTAHADLAHPLDAVQIDVTPTGRSHLEVHLDGGGCTAQTGTAALQLDQGGHLGGSFHGSGLDGAGAPCTFDGTLTGIPVDK